MVRGYDEISQEIRSVAGHITTLKLEKKSLQDAVAFLSEVKADGEAYKGNYESEYSSRITRMDGLENDLGIRVKTARHYANGMRSDLTDKRSEDKGMHHWFEEFEYCLTAVSTRISTLRSKIGQLENTLNAEYQRQYELINELNSLV